MAVGAADDALEGLLVGGGAPGEARAEALCRQPLADTPKVRARLGGTIRRDAVPDLADGLGGGDEWRLGQQDQEPGPGQQQRLARADPRCRSRRPAFARRPVPQAAWSRRSVSFGSARHQRAWRPHLQLVARRDPPATSA
jgi:hypothetical protein